jgi:Bifunctional DNA primase/polymerase, N-terminal
MSADDVCRLAINLARNRNYAVFPCGAHKRPTIPSPNPGEGGFYRASKDPHEIARLWHDHSGPLIGIRTGEASGIDVVDVDTKHDEAIWWWRHNHHRLLPTRTYETRSGGLHLYFRHALGIRNSASRIHKGIDTRGEGGYCIAWFAEGFRCFDQSPPAPWPAWLLIELTRQPPEPPPPPAGASPAHAIAGIVRRLETAPEGERNNVLHWAAKRLLERDVHQAEALSLLLPAACLTGLTEIEARRTIASAYRGRIAA